MSDTGFGRTDPDRPLLTGPGALWLAHCGFRGLLDHGLKSSERFSFTHFGRFGKPK
ncbi:DUF4260 family protein [Pannonibacter phragmitetus]|uniref:DUF4260 family protein n=1 Tax=Pannonibacter phragmitetus TaxID=121719 RepID=UPI003D2F4D66